MRGELVGGGVFCGPYEATGGTGRRKSEELSYIQPGVHREDGVVLPFKENLREQRSVSEGETVLTLADMLVHHLHTRSIMCVTRRSEMPGQDSSARLKAFSSSSMAPTPPPLARRFSFSWTHETQVIICVVQWEALTIHYDRTGSAYLSENGGYQSRQALWLGLSFHRISWLER